MRDEQIFALLQQERTHNTNVSFLGDRQAKFGVEALAEVTSERFSMVRAFFSPSWFIKRFETVYQAKAKAFNEKMNASIAREKLKI